MPKDTRCCLNGAIHFINSFHGPSQYSITNLVWWTPSGFTADRVRWVMAATNEYGLPVNGTLNSPHNDASWASGDVPQARHYPEMLFVLSWQGTATVQVYLAGANLDQVANTAGTGVSTPATGPLSYLNFTGTNPRWELKISGNHSGTVWFAFPNGSAYNNFSAPYFCMKKHEAAHLSGKVWNPDLIEFYRNFSPRFIRHMGAYIAGYTNEMFHDTMHLVAQREEYALGWMWGSQFPRPCYADPISSVNGYQWTCSKPPALENTIQPGEMIWGIVEAVPDVFDQGPITLNVGGRGAKPIINNGDYGFAPLSQSTGLQLGNGGPRPYTFIYDKYFDAYICMAKSWVSIYLTFKERLNLF